MTTTVSGRTARQAALKIAQDLEPTGLEEDVTLETFRIREKGTYEIHIYEGWDWKEEPSDDKPEWMPEETTTADVSKEGTVRIDEV